MPTVPCAHNRGDPCILHHVDTRQQEDRGNMYYLGGSSCGVAVVSGWCMIVFNFVHSL